MNILIVSHEYPPIGGGGANACLFLAKEYTKLGNKVTIITSAYKNLPREEVAHNVRIIRVKALRKKEEESTFGEMFTYLCSALHKAETLVRKEQFDICLVFFGIPSGPIGLYLKKKYHLPYIIRFGGGDIPGAQKQFSFIYSVFYKVLTPALRFIWSNASALVANSEILRQKAIAFEKRYPINVISNGVDNEFFSQNCNRDFTSCIENQQLNILFVSRLIRRKGLQYIIPELKRINQECDKHIHLTVVGDGPFREELERISEESEAGDYITFEGQKNKHELCDFYRAADLFILPSESEGMPNVVLEAMAMGLPIVMTPCGGSDELIQGNGKIASTEDFADALISLCQDDEERMRMGQQSEFLARTKFDWQEKAKEYIKLFEKSGK